MTIRIRSGTPEDLPFMRQMLFEAAYWRGEDLPEFESGLASPELQKLLAGWGRARDTAVVAEDSSKPVGAAWFRFWNDDDHSYGYVSPGVPELAIAVVAGHRGQGLGYELMVALIQAATEADILQLSLSVERDNPARHLYESLGFKTVGHSGNAYTMVVETDGWSG